MHSFEDVPTMAREADLVVRARVSAVAPGRMAGDGGADRIYFRNVTLDVQEVLKGDSGQRSVTIEEQGWDADGTGFVLNGYQWSKVGDQGWFFLEAPAGGPIHVICSYGRFLETGGVHGPSGHQPGKEGPWRQYLGAQARPEVRDLIQEAVSFGASR